MPLDNYGEFHSSHSPRTLSVLYNESTKKIYLSYRKTEYKRTEVPQYLTFDANQIDDLITTLQYLRMKQDGEESAGHDHGS